MAKIKWSHYSIEDLKEICRFIALDSPYYANLLNDRIFEMVEHLNYFLKWVDMFQSPMTLRLENCFTKVTELYTRSKKVIWKSSQ
jgi:hypothetical protein